MLEIGCSYGATRSIVFNDGFTGHKINFCWWIHAEANLSRRDILSITNAETEHGSVGATLRR